MGFCFFCLVILSVAMSKQTRIVLFTLGCIPTRLLLAVLAAQGKPQSIIQSTLAVLFGTIALGFAVIYTLDIRKTGAEVFGDRIWWNHLRPIHAVMYALAALALVQDRSDIAWKVIVADTLFGLFSFVSFHYYN